MIKRDGEPCLLASTGLRTEVLATAVPQVVDTTAAGDSFAAGYLASIVWDTHPGCCLCTPPFGGRHRSY